MRIITLLSFLFLSACASPRVWLSKDDGDTGIVSYENYDPSSDGGKRISNLIPCRNFKMTANPIYRSVGPNQGYSMVGNTAVAWGGEVSERAEYHYRCLPD